MVKYFLKNLKQLTNFISYMFLLPRTRGKTSQPRPKQRRQSKAPDSSDVITQLDNLGSEKCPTHPLPNFFNGILLEHNYTHAFTIVYGCCFATVAALSSSRGHMAAEPKMFTIPNLYGKHLPTYALNYKQQLRKQLQYKPGLFLPGEGLIQNGNSFLVLLLWDLTDAKTPDCTVSVLLTLEQLSICLVRMCIHLYLGHLRGQTPPLRRLLWEMLWPSAPPSHYCHHHHRRHPPPLLRNRMYTLAVQLGQK